MDTKQIEVSCPCCEAQLLVDVRTQKVLRHAPPAQLDETGKPILDEGRWDSAVGRVSDRKGRSGDSFDEALGREQSREKDLDDLFSKPKDKIQRRKDSDAF